MGVKLGLSDWGTDGGCFRTGFWGEYLDLTDKVEGRLEKTFH